MMSLIARCGRCGKSYRVDEAFAGRRARCKACGGGVEVPAEQAVAALASTPAVGGPGRVGTVASWNPRDLYPAVPAARAPVARAAGSGVPAARAVTPDYYVEQ